MIAFSATVGGQDISNHIVGIYRDHSICEGTATVEILLDPEWSEAPAFEPYDEIVIQEEGTGTFKGYVTPISKSRLDPKRTITGQDFSKKVIDTWLTEWETGGSMTPASALTDLFTESGLSAAQYNLRDSTDELLPDKDWTNTSAWDICEEILTMMGWQIWADGDGVLQIGEIRFGAATHTFQEGTNLISVTRRRDDSYTRNAIAVYGSDNITAKKQQVAPILSDMERAGAFANLLVHTQALADSLAERALHEFNRLLDVKTCQIIGDATVKVGDVAKVIESWCDLYHDCLITGVRSSLDRNGYLMEVTLDERCPTIWGHDSRPRIMYAASDGAGVYRTDSYDTPLWYAVNGIGGYALSGNELYVNAIEVDCRDPETVWAATNGGLFRTKNGGRISWDEMDPGDLILSSGSIAVSSGSMVYYDAEQDEIHPDRFFFVAVDHGIQESWVIKFSSGSSGGSWSNWHVRYC